MEADNIKKILNKIIWMPYWLTWRLVFIFLFLIVLFSGDYWFPDKNYPEYNDCIRCEGVVKKFEDRKNQMNNYTSLELQDGQEFYIPQPLREAYDWNPAFQEIGSGSHVELLVKNEKGKSYGPRVMALTCNGKSYLTYEQSKNVYQDIETYNRKGFRMISAVLVILLILVSIHLVLQFWLIRKMGKHQYLKKHGNSVVCRMFFQIKSMFPFFFLLAGVLCSGIAWHYHKDWKTQIDIPAEQQCMSVNGYVQNIELQNNGETLGITLNNDATCYAEKKILGETYFSILSDVKEEDYVECLIYSSKKETEPQIISYSNQNEIKITYQQGKDCYLLDATKEEKRIVLWYLCSAFLCMVVSVPILWMRKKEGANPNP